MQIDGKKIAVSSFSEYPLRNDFLREESCGLQPSKEKNGQISWLTQQNYEVSILFQVAFFKIFV